MLKTLLAVSTILIAVSSFAQASVPMLDNAGTSSASSLDQTPTPMKMLADRGGDSGGGGNSGSGGNSGHDDNDDGHDRNDDNDNDNDNGIGNGNNNSGCDSAHDIAEHANCRG
jgi:hypothetical protein